MSKTLLFETESALNELKNLRAAVEKQYNSVAAFDAFTLITSCHKSRGKLHYYLKQKGNSKLRYLRANEDAIVNNIKSERYLRKLLQIIDQDIRLLECVNKDYVIPQHAGINSLLPKTYRMNASPVLGSSSDAAKEWKKKKEAEKSRYAVYRPEDLNYMALDGTMMRSLSEVNIANYLISLGITFVYELPITVNGIRLLPDFIILSPIDNKTEILIEHQGAMGNENYHSKYIRTLLNYLNTPLIPNKDVFFTFNHLDGHLDLRQIDYILHVAFGFDAHVAHS